MSLPIDFAHALAWLSTGLLLAGIAHLALFFVLLGLATRHKHALAGVLGCIFLGASLFVQGYSIRFVDPYLNIWVSVLRMLASMSLFIAAWGFIAFLVHVSKDKSALEHYIELSMLVRQRIIRMIESIALRLTHKENGKDEKDK